MITSGRLEFYGSTTPRTEGTGFSAPIFGPPPLHSLISFDLQPQNLARQHICEGGFNLSIQPQIQGMESKGASFFVPR